MTVLGIMHAYISCSYLWCIFTTPVGKMVNHFMFHDDYVCITANKQRMINIGINNMVNSSTTEYWIVQPIIKRAKTVHIYANTLVCTRTFIKIILPLEKVILIVKFVNEYKIML